jgi:MFS family permease
MQERRIIVQRTTPPATPPVPQAKLPVLISRNYALLWGGQALSGLGDALFQTTVILWIATRLAHGASWAPLAVAGVFLATVGPEILVGPLAGVFVDRWDKRRTMLSVDLARAGLLALLLVAAGAALPGLLPYAPPTGILLGLLYATLALVTVASQFFWPARLALIGDIVPDAQRERASGLAQTSGALAAILGPALAAPLFFAVGPGGALAFDALSFLVSFGAIALVQAPPAAHRVGPGAPGQVGAELWEGVHLLLSTRALQTLLIVGLLISMGFGALDPLAVFFLRQNLHAAAALFGLLGAAQGAGALLGAVVGGPLAERIGVGRVLWQATLVLGLLFLLLARLTSVAPALAVLFLLGAIFAVVEVAETPLLLRTTPRAALGRVAALLIPLYGLSAALASMLAGWLASTVLRGFHASLLSVTLGPLDTILTGAGLLVVAGGLYARGAVAAFPARPVSSDELA